MPRSQWSTTRLPDLVGVKEACKILGIDRRQLTRWCQAGSGSNGPRRTYMPPWQEVASTKIWTRADIKRLAEQRASRLSGLHRRRVELRAELQVEPAGDSMRWITWNGSTVAVLAAAAHDGTGPWSVGPHKPADDPGSGTEWAAGQTLAAATRKGLDLVAERLAQDLARGVDPTGPGGFAGLSLLEPERPEPSTAGDGWRLET